MKMHLPLLTQSTQLPWYIIALFALTAVLIIALIIVLIIFFKKGKATKIDNSLWLDNLGGKDNIVSVNQVGSRINLSLKDKDIINKDSLKELGVKSILVMSNKVTLVVESNADNIARAINEALNN